MGPYRGAHDNSEYSDSNVDFTRATTAKKTPLRPIGECVGPPDSPSVNTPAAQTTTARLTRPQKEKLAPASLILELTLSDVVFQLLFEPVT